MSARAIGLWFGPSERPLFGRLYLPEGQHARAAVLLCPSLGLEAVCAGRTYRVLAERLAAAGFAAMRFDYDGTGDSAGSAEDPKRVEAWQRSIEEGARFLRSTGASSLAIVGMRIGATLSASVADACGLDALVLWDPCATGRTYLREQQALRAMHVRLAVDELPEEPGEVETLGVVYSPQTVSDLSDLTIGEVRGDLARRMLVLTRPERKLDESVTKRLSMAHVEWGEASGQRELIGVEPWMAKIPESTVETVVTWLSSTLESSASDISVPRHDSAVVERAGDVEVVEEVVGVGPVGLFGVISRPLGRESSVGVVFLNSGVIDHVGPARAWVTWARRWAAAGMTVLRVDLSGLGDSPVRPGQRVDIIYPLEAFDDLEEIAKAISPRDPSSIVLVGLCSGAYHAVEGGIAMGVRSVCAINPILTPKPPELLEEDPALRMAHPDPRRHAVAARRRWVRRLPAHGVLGPIVDRLPDPAWWLINRIGVEQPPARAFERLVARGVDTFVLCGDPEARLITRGARSLLRRLQRGGRFRLEVVPGIDHELFGRSARRRIEQMLTAHLVERFGSGVRVHSGG